MALSKKDFSDYVKQFKFRELFNYMSWNNDRIAQTIAVDNATYTLQVVAEKSGFKILICENDSIPVYNIRKTIETKVTKLFQEHLIIFCNAEKTKQIWQFALRQAGKPTKITETQWNLNQSPELLYQRAAGAFFEIDEEERITIIDVKRRMEENFQQNNERVTKKFYDEFKKEHKAFLSFIKGIEEKTNQEWYASLMLNRLMFCYFIQKKGFLDNNKNYLRDKLNICKEKKGKVKFYSFYRDFLLVLFHKGLNNPAQSPETKIELGKIPYLNGGLFDEHELEKTYQKIDIDDKAFENIFKFFDDYEWHLDTRIEATGKDINPDVIGYIFEKYINDRANMGAYYTKEDITDYISKNCIIPFLFNETQKHLKISDFLKDSDDRYIYDAVKKGVELPLPAEIEIGINTTEPNLLERRKEWNKSAPEEYALPTEIWREVVERRNRYADVKTKIEMGKITEINDFITYNLNISQFAQDVIENTKDPEFLKAFYNTLTRVTILDPTCGSGAFLFAAMNILESLYEACIQRMEIFVAEANKGKYKFFEEVLEKIKRPEHPNLQYFIYKNIILNNLYGVDIMKEAIEIAKLRLFLKLVATVEADYRKPNLGLEPLPDIDFNIRAGNTLVGFATLNEAVRAINAKDKIGQMGLVFEDELDIVNAVKDKADDLAVVFRGFKRAQLDDDLAEFAKAKLKLQQYQADLNKILNEYLAFSYGIDAVKKSEKYEQWLASHQPFHWFAEFYEIVQGHGGFDVIIGNPPYVEYSKVKNDYQIKGYEIESCGNLYAYVVERAYKILITDGNVGLIVPISFPSTPRMITLRNYLNQQKGKVYISNFADRPGTLFSGVHQKTSILISLNKLSPNLKLFTTNFLHWYSNKNKNERDWLFNTLCYTPNDKGFKNYLKLGNDIANRIFNKINKHCNGIGLNKNSTQFSAVLNMRMMFWGKCFLNDKSSSEYKTFYFITEQQRDSFVAHMNSSLFFLYWESVSDCWHITKQESLLFEYLANTIFDNNLSITIQELEIDLEKNKKYVGSVQTEYEYYHKLSKPIIDKIDRILAKHYGFTDEELDFIINYDIKYRMGKELEED